MGSMVLMPVGEKQSAQAIVKRNEETSVAYLRKKQFNLIICHEFCYIFPLPVIA